MSDLDNAILAINQSADKTTNTATFLDDLGTFDKDSNVTNPNNGQTVPSIAKRIDEIIGDQIDEINETAAQVAEDAQEIADAADLFEEQREQFDATFTAQFQYARIGNISDFVGDTLTDTEKLNSYQYPDDSDNWYGPIQSQTFPITIPADPSVSGSGWSLVNSITEIQAIARSLNIPVSDVGYASQGQVVKTFIYDDFQQRIFCVPTGAEGEIVGQDGIAGNILKTEAGGDFLLTTVDYKPSLKLSSFNPTNTIDDKDAFIAWLNDPQLDKDLDCNVRLESSIDVSLDNLKISGQGVVTLSAGVVVTNAIRIGGNNNKWKDSHVVHEGQHIAVSRLVWMEGNRNRLENLEGTFLQSITPVDGQQYSGVAFTVTGDACSVVRCYGSDVGSGVEANGKNPFIQGNNFTRYCRLVINSNKSRNHIVDGNFGDADGKGQGLQGCDGFLDNRSARFGTFTNNRPVGCGEHGAYLQGDGFVWDKTNYIQDTHARMIKVGSKPTGNYAYPGETLPTFNEFGEPDPAGVYACNNATIEPRGRNCNASGGSDGVVSIQTNVAQLTIVNYSIDDCINSQNSIRTLYLESEPEENQKVMANITILEGRSRNSGKLFLACRSGLVVDGVDIDDDIVTSAKTGETCISPKINAKKANIIQLDRASYPLLTGCNVVAVNESNCTDASLLNCHLSDQSQGGGWVSERVTKVNGGSISWMGDSQFDINGVSDFTNVEVNIPDYTGSYALTYTFGLGNPTEGSFNGNIIKAKNCNRPVRIGGDFSSVNSNTVVGSPSSDRALTIQGDTVKAVGNSIPYGNLRFESTSKNCYTDHLNVSDGGTGNFGNYKGVSGSFTSSDGKSITVENGIIVSIV